MNTKNIITALIIALLVLTGCNIHGTVVPPVLDDSLATSEGIQSVANSSNQFAFDLYSKLSEEEGNVFFSPYSISTALSMTYEGARGETAEQMADVLHLIEDNTTRRSSFAAIHNIINTPNAEYKLHTANALWAQKNYTFLGNYTNTIENYYGGKITNLDFLRETEKSRKTINNWVEEQTNNKIKDLLPPGSVNYLTRLVLTNAIYFKGTWVKQFDKKDTREQDFRISPDNTVKVPMMRRTDKDARFNYAETEELQILEMLYEGENLSMLVLLPRNENLHELEESLTAEKLEEWKAMLREQKVDVYIPKFKFTQKYSLSRTLAEMGMPLAFTPDEADFSGMDGTSNLFISGVFHKAFVDVNEKGTEAAAATGVVVGMVAMPNSFRADHPFNFLIQERGTGSILFMGRVVDPSE
jgi:serpin B